MDRWFKISLILCLYGVLKELRPSEPYLTEYLIQPEYVNITKEEASQEVYPVWTYSYLSLLVLVFLVTDILRYKSVIVFEGFAYVATWILLLYSRGVQWMQFMQFVYAVATSTEVAYYAYIFAQVEPQYYRKVTSYTRASILIGRFLSGLGGQVIIYFGLLTYRGLNFFSLGSVMCATVISFILPPVRSTLYFNSKGEESDAIVRNNVSKAHPLRVIKEDAEKTFKNGYVLKWSIWWAIATCGNFQVGNYIQVLWEEIHPDKGDGSELFNGGVEAITTLTGALLSLLFGYIPINWSLAGEPTLAIMSLLEGILLIIMSGTSYIWVAYANYWMFRAFYQMLITVTTFEVAKNILPRTYGLVFGVNTFFALLFQTILTISVADKIGLALPIRTQFIIYGAFWIVCGIGFAISSLIFFIFQNGWSKFKVDGIFIKNSLNDKLAA